MLFFQEKRIAEEVWELEEFNLINIANFQVKQGNNNNNNNNNKGAAQVEEDGFECLVKYIMGLAKKSLKKISFYTCQLNNHKIDYLEQYFQTFYPEPYSLEVFEIKKNVVEDSKTGKKQTLILNPAIFGRLFNTLSQRRIINQLKVLDLSRNQWEPAIFEEIFKGILQI